MNAPPDPAPNPEADFDAFAVLGLERDLAASGDDAVETAWRALSRELHPDTETGDANRAAAVNRARQLLHSPGPRLRHWLTLHGVESARHSAVDPALMDLFSVVGTLLAEADDLLQRRAAAASALAKALLAEPEIALQQRLQTQLAQLQTDRDTVTSRFPAFEKAAAANDFTAAIAAAARLGFLEKWQHQIQQRLLTLIAGD